MTQIVGVAGSWRKGSYNAALLKAAAELMPTGATLEIFSIRDIPLYDGDVEAEGELPEVVTRLKDALARSDGLLIATPEYNNSIPGTVKNAIDWLSRPASDIKRVFGGLPVGLLGASPGSGGTRMAQTAWLPVLRYLTAQPFLTSQITFGEAGKLFDGDGMLADERAKSKLSQYLAQFVDFARAVRPLADEDTK